MVEAIREGKPLEALPLAIYRNSESRVIGDDVAVSDIVFAVVSQDDGRQKRRFLSAAGGAGHRRCEGAPFVGLISVTLSGNTARPSISDAGLFPTKNGGRSAKSSRLAFNLFRVREDTLRTGGVFRVKRETAPF